MILKKDSLNDLLDLLAQDATVYVPQPLDDEQDVQTAQEGLAGQSGLTHFAPYTKGSAVDFGGAKTSLSPKEMLFPQTETLYSYSQLGEDITIVETVNETNQVLFGVRSCDSYSIEQLDKVFLTRSYVDPLYYERRINTLIVAMGCTAPERSCFCTSFDIDPALAPGADIQLTDAGDGYFVEALTDKGTEALKKWEPLLVPGDKPAPQPLEFSLEVDTNNIKATLETLFDDPYWKDLSLKCLNCGTCAFVCPTCHCFDMSQNNSGNNGYRFRTWDSCMYTDYAMMAGFHNPRPSKRERLRQRFMHKLSFYEDRYQSSMCSGCGRCIELCPVGIDISRVIEDAQELSGKTTQDTDEKSALEVTQ